MSFYAKMGNLSTFWGILGLKQGVFRLISIYDTDIEIVIRSDKYRRLVYKASRSGNSFGI